MKKLSIISAITLLLPFCDGVAFAQTQRKSTAPTQNAVKEYKTTVGTFTLETSEAANQETVQYVEETISTTDGGTAASIVTKEAEPGNQLRKSEMQETPEITLYPNPGKGEFTVSGLEFPVELKIYTVLGEAVYNSKLETENLKLNLPPGIYFYKLTDESGTVSTGKLILN